MDIINPQLTSQANNSHQNKTTRGNSTGQVLSLFFNNYKFKYFRDFINFKTCKINQNIPILF